MLCDPRKNQYLPLLSLNFSFARLIKAKSLLCINSPKQFSGLSFLTIFKTSSKETHFNLKPLDNSFSVNDVSLSSPATFE